MNIKELCKQAHKTACEKGFWNCRECKDESKAINCVRCIKKGQIRVNTHNKAEKIALMHAELSEALEALRSEDTSKNNIGEELADCCIRIFDFCAAYEIDLEQEIIKKMRTNTKRPIRHGKRF